MNPKSLEALQKYLAGEVDLESAAQLIHEGGEWNVSYFKEGTSVQQEQIENLMGRLLWLSMRESGGGAPDVAFTAPDIRAMVDGTFFDGPGLDVEFIAANASEHRDQLIDLNVEYLSWVFDGIEKSLGIPANEVVGKPASEYVPETIEKVCGDSPPKGVFYLIQIGGELAGMGGVRFIAPGVGEIKRIYVRPNFRGTGLGSTILTQLLSDAKTFGYKSLCLDSGPFMKSAHKMYDAAGFTDCEAYEGTEVPLEFRDRWRFMSRDL